MALFRPDQQVYARDVRTRVQQFLHQHLAHEPCGAGDEYVAAAEKVRYRTGGAGHFGALTVAGTNTDGRRKTTVYDDVMRRCSGRTRCVEYRYAGVEGTTGL